MSTPDDPDDPSRPEDPAAASRSEGEPTSRQSPDATTRRNVDDAQRHPHGAAAGAGRAGGNRAALWAGGGIAGVVVVLAIVFASLYATDTAPFGGSGGSGDDDADITAVATAYADALLNQQNAEAVAATLCAQDAQAIAGKPSGEGRPDDDLVDIDGVSGIDVDGDSAHATITVSGNVDGERESESATIAFVREGGAWKACPSADSPSQQAPGQGVPGQGAPQQGVPQQGGAPADGGAAN